MGSIGMLLKRQNHCLFSSFFCRRPSSIFGSGKESKKRGSPPLPSPSRPLRTGIHRRAGTSMNLPSPLSVHRSKIKPIGICVQPKSLDFRFRSGDAMATAGSSPMIIWARVRERGNIRTNSRIFATYVMSCKLRGISVHLDLYLSGGGDGIRSPSPSLSPSLPLSHLSSPLQV